MLASEQSAFTPYGAHELKSSYQKNLIKAYLCTFLLCAAVLLTLRLISKSETLPDPIEEPEGPKDPDGGGKTTMTLDGRKVLIIPSDGKISKPRKSELLPRFVNLIPVEESYQDDSDLLDYEPINSDLGLEGQFGDGPVFGGENGNTASGDITGSSNGGSDDFDYIPSSDEFLAVEKVPEMIRMETPQYPRLARQAGLRGTVWIQALVNRDGTVDSAKVLRSSDVEILDDVARAAGFKNVYRPAIQNGRPVYCWISYKVEFRLDK